MVPAARLAIEVFRQNRSFPSSAGTFISWSVPCTSQSVPVMAFSGRPPSLGGLKRGSRQVPVQVEVGSILASALVSL